MNDFTFVPMPRKQRTIDVMLAGTRYTYTETIGLIYRNGLLVADECIWFINDSLICNRYYVRLRELVHLGSAQFTEVLVIRAESNELIKAAYATQSSSDIAHVIVQIIATHEQWTTLDYYAHGMQRYVRWTEQRAYRMPYGSVSIRTASQNDAFCYRLYVGYSDPDYDDDNVQCMHSHDSPLYLTSQVQPSLQHLISMITESITEETNDIT